MKREEPSLEMLWLQNIRMMDKVQIIDRSDTAPRQKHLEMNHTDFFCMPPLLHCYKWYFPRYTSKVTGSSGWDTSTQLYVSQFVAPYLLILHTTLTPLFEMILPEVHKQILWIYWLGHSGLSHAMSSWKFI
jgi:hypothetical protein